MALRFGNTTITRVIYNRPSAGISRELDVVRYSRGGSTTTVFEATPLQFSGDTNVSAVIPSGRSVVELGITIFQNGTYDLFYGYVVGQGSYSRQRVGGGTWIKGSPISNPVAAGYEAGYAPYPNNVTSYNRLDSDRSFYRAQNGNNQSLLFQVRIRNRSNTSENRSQTFTITVSQ